MPCHGGAGARGKKQAGIQLQRHTLITHVLPHTGRPHVRCCSMFVYVCGRQRAAYSSSASMRAASLALSLSLRSSYVDLMGSQAVALAGFLRSFLALTGFSRMAACTWTRHGMARHARGDRQAAKQA